MVENQAYVFFMTIIIGIIFGLIFDFFRVIRRKGNTRDLMVYLQDVAFWLIVTVIIIVSTFLINNGELRGYMILGYVLGGIFYILLFSNLIRKLLTFIFNAVEKMFIIIVDFIKNGIKRLSFLQKKKKI